MHTHTGGLTINQYSTKQSPNLSGLKHHTFISCLCLLPVSTVNWLFVTIPLRQRLKENANQKTACHCDRRKREVQRISHWRLNDLAQKWHTSFLLKTHWPEVVTQPCPTRGRLGNAGRAMGPRAQRRSGTALMTTEAYKLLELPNRATHLRRSSGAGVRDKRGKGFLFFFFFTYTIWIAFGLS